MALENYRIIDWDETESIDNTDFALVDSSTNGTKKFKLSRIPAQAQAEAEALVGAEATARDAAIASAIGTEVTNRNAAIAANIDETLAVSGKSADAKATGDAIAGEATARNAAIAANVDATLTTSGKAADAKKTGDEIADLKADLSLFSGYQNYALTLGKYYATNGQTVNIDTPSSNAGWKSCVVPCSEGDVFTITGHSGSSPRLWCFVDASESTTAATVLSVAIASKAETNGKITAPANVTHLVCNFNKDYDAKLEKGETFPSAMSRIANEESALQRIANSVFTTDAQEFSFILDANIYVTGYEKVGIDYFWYNSSAHPNYETYIRLRGFKNNVWEAFTGFYRTEEPVNRPDIEKVSVDGVFDLLINWNMVGESFNNKTRPEFKSMLFTEQLVSEDHIADYAVKDTTAHIVHVASDGSGDYTTLTAAYAGITDSSFDNQYEIIVHDGTYLEQYLTPPPYTHTHGTKADQVIISSVGLPYYDAISDWASVFQILNTCKLSNMTIVSGTKYCIHEDSARLSKQLVICENLIVHQTKAHNVSAVGNGTQFGGTLYIYRNCAFINGYFVNHTNTVMEPGANQYTILESCKFIDGSIVLSSATTTIEGLQGLYVFEINNCLFPVDKKAVLIRFGDPITGLSAPNNPWTLCGSGNQNFGVGFDNSHDTDYTDCWDAVNTVEKTFVKASESITKDDYVTADGHVTTQSGAYGIAVKSGSIGDYVPVWTGYIYQYP